MNPILYIIFKITFDNGNSGHFTLIDTAGRESPIEIYKQFINTEKVSLPSIMSPSGGRESILTGLKEEYSTYSADDIYNLLKEGFYINESLNHLVYFFNQKNNVNTNVYAQSGSLQKYNPSKYYISPKTEMVSIKEANNCLTIPIMQFLDNLSKYNDKPSKFIIICNIREESEYCQDTIESLSFVNSIKSS